MKNPPAEESVGLLSLDEPSLTSHVDLESETPRWKDAHATKWPDRLFSITKARWMGNWTCSIINFVWFFVPSFLQGSHGADSQKRRSPTAYLDGMRGVAALIVYIFHNIHQCYNVNVSWGANGEYYDIMRLPVIRVLTVGTPSVSIFFVISGYALSYRPLQFIRSQNKEGLATTLSSLAFRRVFRLFGPVAVSTFMVACLLQLGAFEPTREFTENRTYLRVYTEKHIVPMLSAWDQFKDWAYHVYTLVYVFGWDHRGSGINDGYDAHLWTIPNEYRCSLYLFLILIATARLKTLWRYSTLFVAAVVSYTNSRWDFLTFLAGMAIAEWDHIRGSHAPPSDSLTGNIETSRSLRRIQTIAWFFASFFGLYLMSFPILDAENTPGFVLLNAISPGWWSGKLSHLWESIGAAIFVAAVSHLPLWQRVFNTSLIQYLGRISYALYLMHGPVMHVASYHLAELAWHVTGVEGDQYHLGFVLGLAFSTPIVIWVADIFWRAVDIPINGTHNNNLCSSSSQHSWVALFNYFATMALVKLLKHCLLSLAIVRVACHSPKDNTKRALSVAKRQADSAEGPAAINISVPIDHFHNDSLYEPHSDGTFPLRYWFDAKHYKQGGPVIILAAGETSGEDRLPFLDYGILDILANATGGIGVILEHRYYGSSFPVPDLSTKNMRFLSTEQALADTAYFAQHVQFPGYEHLNLTAPDTPYIIYGGSYAGAFAAFARKVYPDVFWGAISSSGVAEAIYDYWEYYDAAPLAAPRDCIVATQKLTHVIDKILLGKNRDKAQSLKDAFGLGELEDADFANTITRGISSLQSTNWDPALDSSDFGNYCAVVASDALLIASTRHLISTVHSLLSAAGYREHLTPLTNQMLNYIGYVRSFVAADAASSCTEGVVDCYGTEKGFNLTGLDQYDARSWVYQTCTQWGFYQTGSGVPKDQLPLISRLIDLKYSTKFCRGAFNITTPPNVESINKLGGVHFSYPRVAFIDGQLDPWRAATPHRIGLPHRKSTTSEPFILIEDGVHHWDENGVKPNDTTPNFPPSPVAKAQEEEVRFVKEWLKEWTGTKAKREAGVEL
ncbi:hypothetical protein G7046_g3999 [Stylonectria norvegica]|nr:hypothetical protein G7046_g3999 [Stylonectria norvegica]